MNSGSQLRMLWVLALSIALGAGAAFAQDTQMEEVEDVIVVTASRTEQALHEVPAAVSVLQAEQIEQIPADDFGDLLRNIPGMNVTQISARDVNMKTRGATGSLETAQLVLLDGRSIYLDFFGFVMWDFLPVNLKEIKQIEVVRGPGSAVWGANAMGGVVNLITKKPSEMVGTTLTVGGGELGTAYASLTVAGVSDRLGYKLSGGYYEQDAYDRPTGFIPGTGSLTNPNGQPYPPFENQGTEQPKLDARFDYDSSDDTTWRFAGGYAGTDGIMHTGIGPFAINDTATMMYGKVDYNKRALQVSAYANLLDGDATNLLAVGIDGQPLEFMFVSDTYSVDFTNTSILGQSQILTYGGNYRLNDFDLSIASQADEREEYGVFLQDEILLGEKLRWVIGGRWDEIDPLADGVFSPRTSLVYAPTPNNSFRVSYNEAFRAPSMINNYLDIIIINVAPLPTGPFPFPSLAGGNVEVTEETLTAVEAGWIGTFDATTVTLSVYENETEDMIDFYTESTYSGAFPPPNFPLPPFFLDIPPPLGLQGLLPATFNYRNVGKITDRGVEFSYAYNPRTPWSFYFNGSWQDTPEVEGVDQEPLPNGTLIDPINQPPEWRFNGGLAYNADRWFFSANANYQDEAFWTDVLNSAYWGPTESFTTFNAGVGVRLGNRMTFSIDGQNITDEDAQYHVFGDIISRKVTGRLVIEF